MTTEDALAEKRTYRFWPTVVIGTLIPWIWIALLVANPASSPLGIALEATLIIASVALSIRNARSRVLSSPSGITLINTFRTYRFAWSEVSGFEVKKEFLYPHAAIRLATGTLRTISSMIPFSFPYLSYFGDRFARFVEELEKDRKRWDRYGAS